jgi:MOSC domain-containing protein YiiM
MQIISVNIGQSRTIERADTMRQTGIYKLPFDGPVEITPDGLAGDVVADVKHHGGPDQAVYIYGESDYQWWQSILGRELLPGTFGENLTISDLESTQFSVGDRLHFATVILEVTAPRIPCGTLSARMGDPGFVRRFRQAERPGLYCRVIQPGWIQAGETVRWERFAGPTVTILEMFRDYYEPDLTSETLQRYLAAPIAIRDRAAKEKRLET